MTAVKVEPFVVRLRERPEPGQAAWDREYAEEEWCLWATTVVLDGVELLVSGTSRTEQGGRDSAAAVHVHAGVRAAVDKVQRGRVS